MSTAVSNQPLPRADDVEPVLHETRDRIATGIVTAAPILALGFVVWQVWGDFLRWSDVIVFAIMYLATGLGITVGFHRYFTHRSFQTSRSLRAAFAVLGSAAIEGPVISWVADHRKHHTFADQEGDPHSPHVDHGVGWRGAFKGLLHAHVGWLFIHTQRGLRRRYARDLIDDPTVNFVDQKFIFWAVGGLGMAFALGWAIGGSLYAGLTGLLWGGAVRMLVVHHVTFSINSLCHFFGRRRFETEDESRNLMWLAPFSFGELAQQPPRLPHLGRARNAQVGVRPLGAADPRDGEGRVGVGRGPSGPRAPGAPKGTPGGRAR